MGLRDSCLLFYFSLFWFKLVKINSKSQTQGRSPLRTARAYFATCLWLPGWPQRPLLAASPAGSPCECSGVAAPCLPWCLGQCWLLPGNSWSEPSSIFPESRNVWRPLGSLCFGEGLVVPGWQDRAASVGVVVRVLCVREGNRQAPWPPGSSPVTPTLGDFGFDGIPAAVGPVGPEWIEEGRF